MHGKYNFCFLEFSGIFFPGVFYCVLVESEDAEPTDIKGQLNFKFNLLILMLQVWLSLIYSDNTLMILCEHQTIVLSRVLLASFTDKSLYYKYHTYHCYNYSRPTGRFWVLEVTRVSLQRGDCRIGTPQTVAVQCHLQLLGNH